MGGKLSNSLSSVSAERSGSVLSLLRETAEKKVRNSSNKERVEGACGKPSRSVRLVSCDSDCGSSSSLLEFTAEHRKASEQEENRNGV